MRLSETFRPYDRIAYRNSIQDGLVEVALGLFLAFSTLLIGTRYYFALFLVLFLLIPALRSLQERYTMPRIGYVKPIADQPKDVLPGILKYVVIVFALAILILYFTIQPDGNLRRSLLRWLPAITGVLLTGGFWYAASRSHLKRFYAFAILAPVAGALIAAIELGNTTPLVRGTPMPGVRLLLLAISVITLISGIVNFYLFLHRHPVQPAETHHVSS